jgi:hypothetical protein
MDLFYIVGLFTWMVIGVLVVLRAPIAGPLLMLTGQHLGIMVAYFLFWPLAMAIDLAFIAIGFKPFSARQEAEWEALEKEFREAEAREQAKRDAWKLFLGRICVVEQDLRPVGSIRTDEAVLPARSNGDWIRAGEKVQISGFNGFEYLVSSVPQPSPTSSSLPPS